MNLFVCAVFGIAIILQIEHAFLKKGVDPYAPEETCAEELKLNRHDMQIVVQNFESPEDDVDHGRFFVCSWGKRGIMTEDGTLKEEKIREFLEFIFSRANKKHTDILDKISKRCVDVKGVTPGQTGIKLKNCIMQQLYSPF